LDVQTHEAQGLSCKNHCTLVCNLHQPMLDLQHIPSFTYIFSCVNIFFCIFWGDFFSDYIQHCFICRLSDSTVPTDAGIEPRTVGALALCQFVLNYDYLRILPALLPCRRTRSEMVKPRSMASQTRKAALIPETPSMLNLGIYE
jgi:hypothetical protein